MPKQTYKHVFTDMLVVPATLLDSQEDGKTRVRFKATQSNVVNSNVRLYPYNVLNDAVEESNELIHQSRMIGESPHPKHFAGVNGSLVFDTRIENSVIKIFNQFMDENGVVYVDAEVLDTAKGRDLKALIDAGVPVGISMRAVGDSKKKQINGAMVDVATKLKIYSYDVVMNPATPGCEVVQVLTDSQMEEVLSDGVQTTVPPCPKCSTALEPQDPDGDGDIDFYSCDTCKEVFPVSESMSATSNAYQRVESIDDYDWDAYSLAREFRKKLRGGSNVNTDQIQGDDEEVKIEDILKAMKDSPEFAEMVKVQATTIAQPALDAVQAQKDAENKLKALETAKAETKAFVDEKLTSLKGKVADAVLTLITDSVQNATSKDTAEAVIDSMINLYSKTSSQANLDSLGFVGGAATGADGHVRVEVTNEQKPWVKHMKAMADSMDREAILRGETIDPSIRKVNQPIVDKLIEHAEKTAKLYDGNGNVVKQGYEAMKDSAEYMDSIMQDSVSVTTGQVLNQPTISALLLQQTFQDVESLQFLHTEPFQGSEVRFMSEYYNSVATIDPATGVLDILVPEGNGIQESAVQTSWITFNPSFRRNAISMTTDVINTMMSGPAKYDVLSRGIFHISAEKRRLLDTLAYLEMVASSDEYKPTVVASEVATAVGSATGNITAVSNGTNVAYKYNLTNGGTANATAGTNPVVRPRKKKQTGANGQVTTVISNPFAVTVNGGAALTVGYLDATGNIQGGVYAVDYENGIVYFTSGASLDGTHLPTFAYSAMTNYDRWSLTYGTGYTTTESWTNVLLQQITKTAAAMGSAPRYKRPNTAIMSLNTSATIENASMWYKLNDPVIGSLNGLADSTFFGQRSGVNFARINAPWVGGDSRILLTQKGSTKYAVETPYQIEGPFPKYDSNGNIIDAKLFYGRENSVMCTPLNVDGNGNIINPVSRTIKITA